VVDEVNGTKAIVQIDFGDGFFTTIGQIEFTNSSSSAPIDISNKSYDDYITLMDGELSSRQYSLTGNIFYNSDTSYRKIRELALLGSEFRTKILELSDDPEDFIYWTVISSMSDQLNTGEGIATSVTFLNRQDLGSALFESNVIFFPSASWPNITRNISLDYRTDSNGQDIAGQAENNLFVNGLGRPPSTIQRMLISYNPFSGRIGFTLDWNTAEQPRPTSLIVSFDGYEFIANIEWALNGVNYDNNVAESKVEIYSFSSSLNYPNNETSKLTEAFNYLITSNKISFNVKIEENKQQRFIAKSTINIQSFQSKLGFIEDQSIGQISPNNWNQLLDSGNSSINTDGVLEDINEFTIDSGGQVLLSHNVVTEYLVYKNTDCIIENKRYTFTRKSGSQSRNVKPEYGILSSESGLDLFDIFSNNSQVDFELIEMPFLFLMAQVQFVKQTNPNTGAIEFIYQSANYDGITQPEVGQFIPDIKPGYEDGTQIAERILISIDEQTQTGLMTFENPVQREYIKRDYYFNNEIDSVITLESTDPTVPQPIPPDINNNYNDIKRVYDYLDARQGQLIFIKAFYQDTPWIDPRDL